jgi:hypothetical protein
LEARAGFYQVTRSAHAFQAEFADLLQRFFALRSWRPERLPGFFQSALGLSGFL